MLLGEVAKNAPFASSSDTTITKQSVNLVLSYELMGRWDNLCVSMKLYPRQELAFERV